MKKALFIIASQWYQDLEFWDPYKILLNAWIEIDIASDIKWKCYWAFWSSTESKLTIKEAKWTNYDVIVFIGWPWAYTTFQWDDNYLRLAKEAKIIAAICIAPTIVSDSWLFKWKNVTGWDSGWQQKHYIEQNWWIFTWKPVTVDANIITWNWPNAAQEFGQTILKKLNENND